MPPWVSIPTIVSLSPNTFFVLGERARVRGKILLIRETHASCREIANGPPQNRAAPGGEGLLNRLPKRCFAQFWVHLPGKQS